MGTFRCMDKNTFEKYKERMFGQINGLRDAHQQAASRMRSDPDFESGTYKFDYPRRGLAIIFNITEFENDEESNRTGTEVDILDLTVSFQSLGFDVVKFDNLTSYQIKSVAEEASKRYKHEEADCFVCVLLSHGDSHTFAGNKGGVNKIDHVIFGSDGEDVTTQLIINWFNDDNCPGLINKPRLFFIQACRGDNDDCGAQVALKRKNVDNSGKTRHPIDNSGKTRHPKEKFDGQKKEVRDILPPLPAPRENSMVEGAVGGMGLSMKEKSLMVYSIPLYQDCLIMYATSPGYTAWRVEDCSGAWFVCELCKALKYKSIKSTSFLCILTSVSGAVAREHETSTGKMKQMPRIETMLTKDIVMTEKKKTDASSLNQK